MLVPKKSITIDTNRPHHRITIERYGMPVRVYEGVNRATLGKLYKALSKAINTPYPPGVVLSEGCIEVEW